MKKIISLAMALFTISVIAEEKTDSIPDVVITGVKSETSLRNLPQTVTTIDHKTLSEGGNQNILPALNEYVPGFYSTSSNMIGYGVSTGSSGSMKIRGIGGGAQLLVVIDGQPQYAGLMGHPIPDAYLTGITERVEVLRGPASMLYGSNAMGGVVNIITRGDAGLKEYKSGIKTLTELNASGGSYGTAKVDFTNRIRYKRFSSAIGASFQRTDGQYRTNDFTQAAGFIKLGYDISDNWKANADATLTHFRFTNIGGEEYRMIDYKGKITRGLASVSLSNKYSMAEGSIRGYYDWGHHNINDGYCPYLPTDGKFKRLSSLTKEQTKLYLHNDYIAGINAYETFRFFKGNATTIGMDWQHFGGEAWNEPIKGGEKTYLTKVEGKPVDHITMDEVGVFLDIRQNITKWLTLNGGVRYDWHTRTGSEWIPQGGFAVHATNNDDIKATISKGFRNPTISEMFMFNVNPDLKPESLTSYELGYVHRFEKGNIGANLYYIEGKNLITFRMGESYKNQEKVENAGFEIYGDWHISHHWSVNGNYSFLHMEEPIEGAPEHKLHLGVHCHYGKFSGALSFEQISGLELYEDVEKESYSLLNVFLSYQVCKPCKVWVRGENLLDQRYATHCFVNRFFNFGKVYEPGINFMAGISLTL